MVSNFDLNRTALNNQMMGLSTDTKPTTGILPNSLFWELDTNGMYYFDGTQWQSIGGSGGGGGDDSDLEIVELSFSLASGIEGAVIYGQFIFDYGLETEHIESYFSIESGTVTTHAMVYKGSGSINGRSFNGDYCRFEGDNISEAGYYSAGGSVVINVVSD